MLKVDGMMQLLKKEVEAVSNLTRCMDAFTNNHTRLVVIVDGLDSCEQDKLLQVLDMVSLRALSSSPANFLLKFPNFCYNRGWFETNFA